MTDEHHGYVRAWARRPDGSWVGPAWLSRPVAGSAVAAIDGAGRMHVAWSRAAGISGVPVRAEVTSTGAAGAGAGVLRGDPVGAVSRVTLSRRGPRSLTVRFRLSQPGRVVVQLSREAPRPGLARRLAARGRRGANAVVVPLGGRTPPGRGRYVAEVWNEQGVVSGCSARSRPLVLR
jgi:hypothetical protein